MNDLAALVMLLGATDVELTGITTCVDPGGGSGVRAVCAPTNGPGLASGVYRSRPSFALT